MAVPSSLGSTSQLATLATRADEATGPPPTKFYELRDNLAESSVSPTRPRMTGLPGLNDGMPCHARVMSPALGDGARKVS